MKKKMMIDLVDAFAERAIGQHDASQCDWLYGVENPSDRDLLSDFYDLTEDLVTLLAPVSPSPRFLQQLGTSLAAVASSTEVTVTRPSHRTLWIGAILSGSLVSAAGVLLLWIRRRNRGGTLAAG